MSEHGEERIVAEFTHQASSFNRSPVMNSEQTLAALVASLPAARPGTPCFSVSAAGGLQLTLGRLLWRKPR